MQSLGSKPSFCILSIGRHNIQALFNRYDINFLFTTPMVVAERVGHSVMSFAECKNVDTKPEKRLFFISLNCCGRRRDDVQSRCCPTEVRCSLNIKTAKQMPTNSKCESMIDLNQLLLKSRYLFLNLALLD